MTNPKESPEWETAEWRVGRSLGRTVYAMVGNGPSKQDVLLGMMDTVDIAAHVVTAHNVLRPLNGADD